MVGELNTSALAPGSFMSLRDALAGNMAQDQKLQAGQLANEQAKNQYASQVMSMATSTGNQDLYNSAKGHLNQLGIDTTGWADDVQNGAQQAQSLRLAMSPLGSLLNAASKFDANNISANTAAGKATPNPNANAYALFRGQFVQAGGEPAGQLFDKAVQSGQVPGVSMPTPTGAANNPPPLASPNSPDNQALTAVKNGGSYPSAPAQNVPPPPTRSDQKYNNNGLTEAANTAMFNGDMEAWKSDPAVKRTLTQQEALGTAGAKAQENASSSKQSTGIVEQNINGIIDLATRGNLPEGKTSGISGAIASTLSPRGEEAQDISTFNTLNEAQTIGAIRELADTGQIKMSRTLENIINKGYLVDPSASNAEKIVQAKIILNELKNSQIGAENVSATLNGGKQQDFVPMNVTGSDDGFLKTPSGIKYKVIK